MWKKVIVYFVVACIAFMLGTVSTSKLFAEKQDENVKRYKEILKKLESIEKSQEEIHKIVKRLQYRAS